MSARVAFGLEALAKSYAARVGAADRHAGRHLVARAHELVPDVPAAIAAAEAFAATVGEDPDRAAVDLFVFLDGFLEAPAVPVFDWQERLDING
jgi:hypothetical protein